MDIYAPQSDQFFFHFFFVIIIVYRYHIVLELYCKYIDMEFLRH